jgi:hypothetical protein
MCGNQWIKAIDTGGACHEGLLPWMHWWMMLLLLAAIIRSDRVAMVPRLQRGPNMTLIIKNHWIVMRHGSHEPHNMWMETDKDNLNEYSCFVRKQLELHCVLQKERWIISKKRIHESIIMEVASLLPDKSGFDANIASNKRRRFPTTWVVPALFNGICW